MIGLYNDVLRELLDLHASVKTHSVALQQAQPCMNEEISKLKHIAEQQRNTREILP